MTQLGTQVNHVVLRYDCCCCCCRLAFARALAALYEMDNEIKVQESDAVGVLAAAHFLSFATLEKV